MLAMHLHKKIVAENIMLTMPEWFNLPFWEMEKACGKTRILSVRDL